MGGNKWMKAKMLLGLNLNSCLYVPKTLDDSPVVVAQPSSAATSSSPPVLLPNTPTHSSSGLQLSKQSSKSCKSLCAICLNTMKPGQGHAIFTAECSHAFHFHCIASNVKHGKQSCPICRAKWKEIPFQSPVTDKSHQNARMNQTDDWTTVVREIPSPRQPTRDSASTLRSTEPICFDDDEEITTHQSSGSEPSSSRDNGGGNASGAVEVRTYPEVSAVQKSECHDNFSVLIHLKAPNNIMQREYDGQPSASQTSRAAVDLVTVLDVSGSMAGTKLALLKRAMGFVIQNLGPLDRLSIIAFSSTARRVFPLHRMTDTGKHEAIQAVNALISNGGTNITEGLRKGAKVINDRKWKNPVTSIVLLSDGQDTYNINVQSSTKTHLSSQSLVPVSVSQIPVHAFGFGADHDAVSMHAISEASRGTFSFIETESMIQDAFAQCIGGLLSVVVQDMTVEVECIDPIKHLVSVKSGSYKTALAPDNKRGVIHVGDLYAEEERSFLVVVDIPMSHSKSNEMPLLKVKCVYKHPITKNISTLGTLNDVKIQRPTQTGQVVISMEVDKQKNRIMSAEAMAGARTAAEQGDLMSAVTILETCRKKLSETILAQSGDGLYVSLDAELREMQERMANRRIYEASGRAYVLSGLSSHCWQRATARGDSTESTSLVGSYQTQSMVDMVNLSQTMVFGSSSTPRRSIRPTLSFPARRERR